MAYSDRTHPTHDPYAQPMGMEPLNRTPPAPAAAWLASAPPSASSSW